METLLISHETAYRYWVAGPMRPSPSASCKPIAAGERFVFTKDLVDEARLLLASDARSVVDACVFEKPERHAVSGGRCHYWRFPIGKGSVVRLSDSLAIAPPEVLFGMLARGSSVQKLIALGNSLCSTYPVLQPAQIPVDERASLATVKDLGKVIARCDGLGGAKYARQALRWICEGCASQREATLATIFFTPRCYGGYGFPKPHVNYRIPGEGLPACFDRDFLIADFAWPKERVVVEYDSDKFHSSVEKLAKDSARRNALIKMGYKTIVVTNQMITSWAGRDEIAEVLTEALYGGRRKDYKLNRSKQEELVSAAFRIPSGRI